MDFTCNFVENYVDKGFSVAIEFDFLAWVDCAVGLFAFLLDLGSLYGKSSRLGFHLRGSAFNL